MKSARDKVVQGTYIISPIGQETPFCSGQDRKRGQRQAKSVIGVAQTVILSKTFIAQEAWQIASAGIMQLSTSTD